MKLKKSKTVLQILLLLFLILIAAGLMFLNVQQAATDIEETPSLTEVPQQPEPAAATPEPTPEPTPAPTPEPTPTPEPEYVHFIQENALRAPKPDPEGYHESMDAAELEAFLQGEAVRKLLEGKTLLWNSSIERFPDTPVRWYFDETILCIVWQEVEAMQVGTFSEIVIADGSQLRRKISADTLWSFAFETTSQFAADTNAVLAFGGDFYYHGRNCGISIYQREICRFDPATCDTCYITADGDMLFSYRNQFSEQWQAEQFASENDVLFSLGFGPVLIDEYQDVTPENYPWGEVLDTYARSALGLLEEHHYLTMNLNHGPYGTEYYNLATLRQAADAMLARGCRKAYALDGGQTATTVLGGTLINPVQFGEEKPISDIIYFASALGGEQREK